MALSQRGISLLEKDIAVRKSDNIGKISVTNKAIVSTTSSTKEVGDSGSLFLANTSSRTKFKVIDLTAYCQPVHPRPGVVRSTYVQHLYYSSTSSFCGFSQATAKSTPLGSMLCSPCMNCCWQKFQLEPAG